MKITKLILLETTPLFLKVISIILKSMELPNNSITRINNICINSSKTVLFTVIKLPMVLLRIFNSLIQTKNIKALFIMDRQLNILQKATSSQISIITNSVTILLQEALVLMIFKLLGKKSIFRNKLESVHNEAVN